MEVQLLTDGILQKFVAEPRRIEVLADLLIGLKRFRNSIRWKECIKYPDEKDEEGTTNNNQINEGEDEEIRSSFNMSSREKPEHH